MVAAGGVAARLPVHRQPVRRVRGLLQLLRLLLPRGAGGGAGGVVAQQARGPAAGRAAAVSQPVAGGVLLLLLLAGQGLGIGAHEVLWGLGLLVHGVLDRGER